MSYLLIALAGGLGSVARFAMSKAVNAWTGAAFPYGTLAVNMLGAFLFGFLAWYIAHKWVLADVMRQAVLIGLLGGFTTFSAFSMELVQMIESGGWLKALIYAGVSVISCLALCMAGLWWARQLV